MVENQHARSLTDSMMQAGSPSGRIHVMCNFTLSLNRQRDVLSPSMVQRH